MQKSKTKVLILEGIHKNAVDYFKKQGYEVEYHKKALEEDELKQKIKDVHFIGIRSRTKLTKEVLDKAKNLLGIGAFCIGTNQIDLDYAKSKGIPVFNAPFSNTRSVAELIIAEIIMLMRGIPEKNAKAHQGGWLKSADNSFEIRGKKLGIIGYGHIGSQVSVLAESMGMQVFYYDLDSKLNIGNATSCRTLKELMQSVDVVTLHVPATKETENMIGKKQLAWMRKGSFLINASRGNVVVIEDLVEFLENKHILGVAIDVYPKEPASKDKEFESELRKFDNALLTPHIGGSTGEAQENIAFEVAGKLDKYFSTGSTLGTVNFVQINLDTTGEGKKRYLHVHKNVPGVLKKVNQVFASRHANISGQHLQTDSDIGYVIIEIDDNGENGTVLKELEQVENTIRARML